MHNKPAPSALGLSMGVLGIHQNSELLLKIKCLDTNTTLKWLELDGGRKYYANHAHWTICETADPSQLG